MLTRSNRREAVRLSTEVGLNVHSNGIVLAAEWPTCSRCDALCARHELGTPSCTFHQAPNTDGLDILKFYSEQAARLTVSILIRCDDIGEEIWFGCWPSDRRSSTPVSQSRQSNRLVLLESSSKLSPASKSSSS